MEESDLKTETLTIRVSRRILTQIDELAKENGFKRGQYIRDILRIAVENRIQVVVSGVVSGQYSLRVTPPEKP